jgi:adenosylhomocysteine nucleosidase
MIDPTELLVVFALAEEAGGHFADVPSPVLYTGVGKVNATWSLTRELHRRRPRLVINFGTAGGRWQTPHALVECTRFRQRDMDVSPLGLLPGATPYDILPALLEVSARFPSLPAVLCGTADHFVAGHDTGDCDVVDMEAYALARVCALEDVPFACVKYVTDGGDHQAADDWHRNLDRAGHAFRQVYDEGVGPRQA